MKKVFCKLCRKEGAKLFFKGERCFSEKCPIEKVTAVKGRGRGRGKPGFQKPVKLSEYGRQLKEKQKVKRMAGLRERQFHSYYMKASKKKDATGTMLLSMIERRVENIVFQLGFTSSKSQARQLVVHGHVRVNDNIVDKPSFQLKVGDKVSLSGKAYEFKFVKDSIEKTKQRSDVPGYLQLDAEGKVGTVIALPTRDDISIPAKEQLIVELYSK